MTNPAILSLAARSHNWTRESWSEMGPIAPPSPNQLDSVALPMISFIRSIVEHGYITKKRKSTLSVLAVSGSFWLQYIITSTKHRRLDSANQGETHRLTVNGINVWRYLVICDGTHQTESNNPYLDSWKHLFNAIEPGRCDEIKSFWSKLSLSTSSRKNNCGPKKLPCWTHYTCLRSNMPAVVLGWHHVPCGTAVSVHFLTAERASAAPR